ncbi:MAG: redox-sensing transcriptional repressor Rex, partial [Eubacterium sp.]|nr:redox-sensing transcriptional repressor Rex [Eubacterium sp.]
HLGKAIANYDYFNRGSFQITGLFDNQEKLIGTKVRGQEIRSIEDLPVFLKHSSVDIAALTLPKDSAKEVAKLLVENGIRAIWNFAYTDLELPDTVLVKNVHLSDSLMQLSYRLNEESET